jgi:UDP-4-amino-4-deoxy-L-arabinose-oxoglutarate aminotransferase
MGSSSDETKIPFYEHHLGEAEALAAREVIGSLFLTTGPRTAAFEDALRRLLGTKQAAGVSSCTTALHLALLGLGIGEGDEVITTPMTFIATANTILHAGATPVFVDVEPDTGNLDASRIEAAITPRTKAILPVHLYGQMADMRAIRAVADRHGLLVIEDAAHAVEAQRDGARPGQVGDAACFSFYATKNLAAGEGGAVATNRDALHEQILLLRNHGMSKSAFQRYTGTFRHWDMPVLGYKANMFDLQAAILLSQLPGLEERLGMRERLARRYDRALDALGVDRPAVRPNSVHSRHLYTIWVDPARRDAILDAMQNQKHVGVAVNYRAIHLLEYYRKRFGFREGAFPIAERIGDRTITLPLYPRMPEENVDRVVERLAAVI